MIECVRPRPAVITCLILALVAGCDRPRPGSAPPKTDPTPAELRRGDVVVRATVVPSMQLNAAMALTYGVVPAPERVLLVVGLRQGPAHQEQALDGVL